jgi:polygalacturonase
MLRYTSPQKAGSSAAQRLRTTKPETIFRLGNGNVVMIAAANAENIRIEGPGTIDGNGAKFCTGRGDMTCPGQNSAEGYYQRPHLLIFYRCRNLAVRDVFLTASAYHCIRILRCQRVNPPSQTA